MVDYSTIRLDSSSISFFFARLGVFLEFLSGRCPLVGLFVHQVCALRSVLLELYPLIRTYLVSFLLFSSSFLNSWLIILLLG